MADPLAVPQYALDTPEEDRPLECRDGRAVPSTHWVACESCGQEGWRSDWTNHSEAIVADASGHLVCDDCAE